MSDVVKKQEAETLGLKHYFTGLPCKRGHVCARLLSTRQCVECSKIGKSRRDKEHYKKYKEKILARVKAYAKENAEQIKEKTKKYYEKNKGTIIARKDKWRDDNRQHVRIKARQYAATRKALKLAIGGIVSSDDILALLRKQRYKCVYCLSPIKKKFEADHITPLAKGGENKIRNIQILCQKCNRSKWCHDPIGWAQEKHGLLL